MPFGDDETHLQKSVSPATLVDKNINNFSEMSSGFRGIKFGIQKKNHGILGVMPAIGCWVAEPVLDRLDKAVRLIKNISLLIFDFKAVHVQLLALLNQV